VQVTIAGGAITVGSWRDKIGWQRFKTCTLVDATGEGPAGYDFYMHALLNDHSLMVNLLCLGPERPKITRFIRIVLVL